MSNVITATNNVIIKTQNRIATFGTERGAVSAEFGVVILVAVALALAVFGLIKGGKFDGVLQALLAGILGKATEMVQHSAV